jgi:hypothetical protein
MPERCVEVFRISTGQSDKLVKVKDVIVGYSLYQTETKFLMDFVDS